MIRMSGLCFLSFLPSFHQLTGSMLETSRLIGISGAGDLLNWLVPGKRMPGYWVVKVLMEASWPCLMNSSISLSLKEARPPRKGCAVPSRTTFMDDPIFDQPGICCDL